MTEPRDDELAAMLGARADRMPAATGREVLAAVRDEMRAPSGGAGFAVLPVTNGRGMNGPAGWAAIGLVAVLVLAVMGGRLGTSPAQSSPAPASAGSPASSAAPASAAPATPAAVSPVIPTLTMDQLRTGLGNGMLDGSTVLVTGRLELQPWPCPSPMPDDCYGLQLRGLDGIDVTHAGVMTVDEANARIPGDATDRPMAFRVAGGQLALLGWITQGADTPLTVGQLLQGGPGPGRAEVAAVAGWLLVAQSSWASCPGSVAAPCSDMRPVLADASPRPDGLPAQGDATEVTVDASLGLAPAPATRAGPFLVRYTAYRGGDLPPWGVIASLDPATTVQVGNPETSAAMTPEMLRAAIRDGSMDGRLVEVTGRLRPAGGSCPSSVPQPCTPSVILGLGNIAVTWDGPMPIVDRLGGDTSPTPSTPDTLLLTPRDGHLVLLGRLAGDLGQPNALQQLLAGRQPIASGADPLGLTPVSGWLVVGGLHSCPALGPGATPCPGPPPVLTDTEPSPDGLMNSDLQVPVAVGASAPGIDPAHIVTEGPFLARILHAPDCPRTKTVDLTACLSVLPPSVQVVARYDVGSVYQVTLP